ncbi:MAG: PHP domain-containing protein [Candidatus Diapherotrites archaeon]|nr:PHP domain-containing protein [Candidatus Diapherotrites archaeon]
MRVDLHNHTWFSKDGMMPPGKLLELARRRGIDAIAITDHNRLTKVKDPSIPVIPGEEIKTTKGEVIGLFLNEEIPGGLSPEETFELIEEQGGIAVIPHPFDRFRKRTALLLRISPEELPKHVLIEVINGRYVMDRFRREAEAFARKWNLPAVGGSDAHTPVEVGRAWTEVPEFSDLEELYKHLKKGRTRPAGGYSPPWVHLTVPVLKVLHRLGLLPHHPI